MLYLSDGAVAQLREVEGFVLFGFFGGRFWEDEREGQ